MRRALWIPALLFGLVSAATGQSPTAPSESSRPVRLLRSWYDSIKTRQGDVARRVDILDDYDRAAAFERSYTLDGRPISSRRLVVNPPTPSEEEIAEAFDIVRADPEIARMVRRYSAELEGGFLIEEGRGRACGPGARCLLVQVLSPDHSGLIRVAAVDLVKQQVTYRNFVPSEHPGVK
jgi:hypothetical protein